MLNLLWLYKIGETNHGVRNQRDYDLIEILLCVLFEVIVRSDKVYGH